MNSIVLDREVKKDHYNNNNNGKGSLWPDKDDIVDSCYWYRNEDETA